MRQSREPTRQEYLDLCDCACNKVQGTHPAGQCGSSQPTASEDAK
jgi:hypothetical protein